MLHWYNQESDCGLNTYISFVRGLDVQMGVPTGSGFLIYSSLYVPVSTHGGKRGRHRFSKDSDPIHEDSTFVIQKSHLQILSHWRLGFWHEFGDTYSVYNSTALVLPHLLGCVCICMCVKARQWEEDEIFRPLVQSPIGHKARNPNSFQVFNMSSEASHTWTIILYFPRHISMGPIGCRAARTQPALQHVMPVSWMVT